MSADSVGEPRAALELVDTAEVTTAVVTATGYPMAVTLSLIHI